jgi:membrane protease YdiL (CAAX protease family)
MPWDFWLIFLALAVLIPWRGRIRLQRLLDRLSVSTREKLVLYGTTIAFQWLLMGLVAWRAFARGLTVTELGLTPRMSTRQSLISAAGALLLGGFQCFNLRRVGNMTGAVPDFMRKMAARILPAAHLELAPYFALAITAGICEEFLYRGFAMAALSRAGIVSWAVVVITSVLFGLAHTYQGRSGVVATGLMGLVFGAARIWLQSLLPVMVWHSAVDLVAGVAGPKYLLKPRETK